MTLIDIDDLDALPIEQVATIAVRSTRNLAARASVAAAPPTVPVQLDLLPSVDPLDPTLMNPEERLPDGGLRFVNVKEAAALARCSDDTIRRRVHDEKIGLLSGGRYLIDRTRLLRMV
ncbi:hypothetical protein [Rhizobium leguminosarum]|uniref:hypothetical protein n=1 Tax=Rhizobium leguminosarum TaxID=384 RepID=UPI001C9525BE|nr:hypothetical protein [Rhizobium leguminosarum]MBY5562181.1 hypothetical protein [Rhizobium leguminosarum]